jgi:hypothetical protein
MMNFSKALTIDGTQSFIIAMCMAVALALVSPLFANADPNHVYPDSFQGMDDNGAELSITEKRDYAVRTTGKDSNRIWEESVPEGGSARERWGKKEWNGQPAEKSVPKSK